LPNVFAESAIRVECRYCGAIRSRFQGSYGACRSALPGLPIPGTMRAL
jgi:hypothetical protein